MSSKKSKSVGLNKRASRRGKEIQLPLDLVTTSAEYRNSFALTTQEVEFIRTGECNRGSSK